MDSMKTLYCARKANALALGSSRNGAIPIDLGLSQDTVAPVTEVRISSDMECDSFTAFELKGRVTIVTATSVQVMGLVEYEMVYGAPGQPGAVMQSKSTTSDSSAAKKRNGKEGKKKVSRPPPRPASLMQHGLLPTQTIGEVLLALPVLCDQFTKHARNLRGFKPQDGGAEWETDKSNFVDVSLDDFIRAMCGFAGARENPMAAPTKIIARFKPCTTTDTTELDALYRLVVIGMYLYKSDIRFTAMRDLWNYCDCIPSDCFLSFTRNKVLDVTASFRLLRTLLEPSSELFVEVPEEVVLVYGPVPSKRLLAIAAKEAMKAQEPVLPVTIQHRAMPVVECMTLCPVKPSGSAGNVTKDIEVTKPVSFKVDEKILANEIGDKLLDRKSSKSVIIKTSKKDNGLSQAKLDSFVKTAILAQTRFLKNAEKLSEKMIRECIGSSVIETMQDDKAFAAYLSGCNAENSPRSEIYRVLCVIAGKAWTLGFKTSCAMFFRDMVLDASAFEVYLAGVSNTAVRASQCAAMESLRALLSGYKFCTSTVVVSNTATSVVVEAPPVGEVLEDGFM
jgi:hypothetical protein